MISTSPILSLQQFLGQPDIDGSPAWELLESGVKQKPMPTLDHSELQFNLVTLIRASRTHKAVQEVRCNVGEKSFVPDISIAPIERFPKTGHLDFAPDWVIEIRSPGQGISELEAKILHLTAHGTQLAWLVDLQRARILVWRSSDIDILTGSEKPPALISLDLNVNQIIELAQ